MFNFPVFVSPASQATGIKSPPPLVLFKTKNKVFGLPEGVELRFLFEVPLTGIIFISIPRRRASARPTETRRRGTKVRAEAEQDKPTVCETLTWIRACEDPSRLLITA